jgi:hypothetical protein
MNHRSRKSPFHCTSDTDKQEMQILLLLSNCFLFHDFPAIKYLCFHILTDHRLASQSPSNRLVSGKGSHSQWLQFDLISIELNYKFNNISITHNKKMIGSCVRERKATRFETDKGVTMSHFELKIPYHLTCCHFTLPLSLRVRPAAGVVTETHQPADRTCIKFHSTVGRSTEY